MLGMTTDALRMRWKRGKLEGFKQGRRVFVYVTEQPNNRPNSVQSRTEQAANGDGDQHSDELARLVRDNERLNERLVRDNERLDGLLASHAQERDREQVLRQQLQTQIDRLTEQVALPAPAPNASLQSRLHETESNFGVLKSALIQLLRFLEGKRA